MIHCISELNWREIILIHWTSHKYGHVCVQPPLLQPDQHINLFECCSISSQISRSVSCLISRRIFKIQQSTRMVIRLIALDPSPDIDSIVTCSLFHKSLQECVYDIAASYTALSYVWGDPTVLKDIHVDSKVFPVTISLEQALRHLRDATRVLHVWADAICIDQSSYDYFEIFPLSL
jgi:hypothetical protein